MRAEFDRLAFGWMEFFPRLITNKSEGAFRFFGHIKQRSLKANFSQVTPPLNHHKVSNRKLAIFVTFLVLSIKYAKFKKI